MDRERASGRCREMSVNLLHFFVSYFRFSVAGYSYLRVNNDATETKTDKHSGK